MENKWILVVVDHRTDDKIIKAIDVLKDRVKEKFWSLNKNSGNFNRIRKGDKVIFYMGGRDGQKLMSRRTLASEPYPLTSEQKRQIEGYPSSMFSHSVSLEDIKMWKEPLPIVDLKEELAFIRNKDLWRKYFRRSIIPLSDEDYNKILSRAER